MFTDIIVHTFKCVFTLFILMGFFSVKTAFATEVLGFKIDPPSPAYNQPFTCTLTLDQDDHRNACSVLPLNAPEDMFPWDICQIDHTSPDNLTRYYKCIATRMRRKKITVPGPGNYQMVVWNFTGDGETGQVIARQNITFLAELAPTPTKTPQPTAPPYIPPEPTVGAITQAPPPQSPTQSPSSVQTVAAPTVGVFTQIPQVVAPTSAPTINTAINIFPSIKFPTEMMDQWKQQISSGFNQIGEKTQNSVFQPFVALLLNFMREANY